MTTTDVLSQAIANGVQITIGAPGKLKLKGCKSAVEKLLPFVSQHKSAINRLIKEVSDLEHQICPPNLTQSSAEYGKWLASQLLAQPTYPVNTLLHQVWVVYQNNKPFCCMLTRYCTQSEAQLRANRYWLNTVAVPWSSE